MKASMTTTAAAVIAVLSGVPAAAAPALQPQDHMQLRSGGFAGAIFKVPLSGGRSSPPPQVSLGISRVYAGRGSTGFLERTQVPGIELRFARSAPPRLLFGGETAERLKHRWELGSTGVLLVLGGIGAAGLAVAALSSGGDEQEDELNRRQCLLPEGCKP